MTEQKLFTAQNLVANTLEFSEYNFNPVSKLELCILNPYLIWNYFVQESIWN